MNEFMEQFLLESRELVEQASADLLALEENPSSADRLDGAFRAFHTLKGSAGIVDFTAMAKAAHAAEDMLAAVRAGKTQISRALISNALACLDQIVQWLDAMQVNGEIPPSAERDADAMVQRLGAGPATPERTPEQPEPQSAAFPAAAIALLQAQRDLLLETDPDGFSGRLLSAGKVVVGVLRATGRQGGITLLERTIGEAAAVGDARGLIAAIGNILVQDAPESGAVEVASAPDAAARVLRVDVERIDALVKLTGELTIVKNAIGHAAQRARAGVDPETLAQLLKDQYGQLSRLVEELQRSVLRIRVLPLRHVFSRFPRLVREISEHLGKPARLVMEGDTTEADKVVVENLFEPLLHIIRNAMDHGVENPAERAAARKPAAATIQLRASRSGDVVLVEVEDDGRGIDIARVRRVAAERGLAEPAVLVAMTDEEAADLIFAPGFSTAEKVSDLSGRGVGMDVVRSSVMRLGGTARIASRAGQGTVVSLTLPFSVMMTRVMTVVAGGQTFGIPLESIVETVRIPRERIAGIGAAQAFVFRDKTVPLIDLGQSLGNIRKGSRTADANIVVVSIGGAIGSVEVDQFGDRLDVMLKPMDGLLRGAPGVAGTSLLGDGSVLIVLDLPDLLG